LKTRTRRVQDASRRVPDAPGVDVELKEVYYIDTMVVFGQCPLTEPKFNVVATNIMHSQYLGKTIAALAVP
uniref:Uncharacterized protein n=1 Tax=Romanomermis culicivorax TaxID=13658 RepID=A0A915IUF7_ROMCU